MTVYVFNRLHHAPSRTETHKHTNTSTGHRLSSHTSGSCLGRLSAAVDWFLEIWRSDSCMPFSGACVTLSLFGLFWLFQFALTNTTCSNCIDAYALSLRN